MRLAGATPHCALPGSKDHAGFKGQSVHLTHSPRPPPRWTVWVRTKPPWQGFVRRRLVDDPMDTLKRVVTGVARRGLDRVSTGSMPRRDRRGGAGELHDRSSRSLTVDQQPLSRCCRRPCYPPAHSAGPTACLRLETSATINPTKDWAPPRRGRPAHCRRGSRGPPRRPRGPCGATTSRSGLEFALIPSTMPEQSGILGHSAWSFTTIRFTDILLARPLTFS
jgi:hypothetical protein